MANLGDKDSYCIPITASIFHIFAIVVLMILVGSAKTGTGLVVLALSATVYLVLGYLIAVNRITNKPGLLSKEFRKQFLRNYWTSIVAIFLIFSGQFVLFVANQTDTTIPYGQYKFEVDVSPRELNEIHQLQYSVDFATKTGNITFSIDTKNKSLDHIEVTIPEFSTIKSHQVLDITGNPINDHNYRTEVSGDKIILHSFENEHEPYTIVAEFEGNFVPNGLFTFYNYANSTHSRDLASVRMNLGDFSCNSVCYGQLVNAEPELNGQELTVRVPKNSAENQSNGLLQQHISINTFHLPTQNAKQNLTAFFLSLTIAGILAFFEFARETIVLNVR